MKKLRLTYALIDQICDLVKLRMRWKDIAHAIGVSNRTLQLWRQQGKDAESGIKYDLVCSIAKAEAWLIYELSKVVRDEALYGHREVTTKLRKDNAGNVVGTETTIKQTAPNAGLALKILERMCPDVWLPVHNLKVDYRESLRSQGIDPDLVEEAFMKYLSDNLETPAMPPPPEKS